MSERCRSAFYEATDSEGEEDLGGEDEMLRKLCERHPASVNLPPMHLILAPSLLRHTGVQKAWDGDRIVITIGPKTMVGTRHGDVPVNPELFRTQPVIQYEGFLIPCAAAPLFHIKSDPGWPALTCMKQVSIRFVTE